MRRPEASKAAAPELGAIGSDRYRASPGIGWWSAGRRRPHPTGGGRPRQPPGGSRSRGSAKGGLANLLVIPTALKNQSQGAAERLLSLLGNARKTPNHRKNRAFLAQCRFESRQ